MNKTIIGTIIGVAAFIILFTVYQSAVVIPRERIEAQEAQAEADRRAAVMERIEREQKFDECMASAYEVYSLDWDRACTARGEEPDCTHSNFLAESFNERLEKTRSRCVTMYR